jgi:hypothetical protein
MGRGRSGITNQSRRNTRSDFILIKNISPIAFAGDKKDIRHPFPPEVIEALKKIAPKLFANSLLES